MRSLISLLTLAATLSACDIDVADPSRPDQPTQPEGPTVTEPQASSVTVMSRNMYIGADVDAVIAALASPDPDDDLPTLTGAIAVLEQTDFPARAAAIADEIQRTRPHLVGLQEVSDIDIDLTELGLPIDVQISFLPVLLDELASRGLTYDAAATVQNITAMPLPGIRLVDHDVMLVDRSRVTVTPGSVQGKRFDLNLGTVVPGVDLFRGWVSLEAVVDGSTYTVVSTHLESGPGGELEFLRTVQALEIIAATQNAPRVILLGDLNDVPDSPMHQTLREIGFQDVWTSLRPGVTGNTCCHAADLSNPQADMTMRLDYVFSRGVLGQPQAGVQGQIDLVGLGPQEQLPASGPRWSSDHAGVVATLLTPRPSGTARP